MHAVTMLDSEIKHLAWNFWALPFVRIRKSSHSFLLWGRKTMTTEDRMKQMASGVPNDIETVSPATQAGYGKDKGRAYLIGVAVRPTLLFMTVFALNVTPHEGAHAIAGCILGFSSTLYQMWVNPDAAAATPRQLIAIAVAGPIFSLIVGLISWLLYRQRYSRSACDYCNLAFQFRHTLFLSTSRI